MVEHPAARALTGYLLVRGGLHQVAYARALECLTGWPHPETGEELTVAEIPHPDGAPAHDLPPQPDVSRPATRPRRSSRSPRSSAGRAGLPDEPTGEVPEESQELVAGLLEKAKA